MLYMKRGMKRILAFCCWKQKGHLTELNGLIYLMYSVVIGAAPNFVGGLNYFIVNHELKLLQIM